MSGRPQHAIGVRASIAGGRQAQDAQQLTHRSQQPTQRSYGTQGSSARILIAAAAAEAWLERQHRQHTEALSVAWVWAVYIAGSRRLGIHTGIPCLGLGVWLVVWGMVQWGKV